MFGYSTGLHSLVAKRRDLDRLHGRKTEQEPVDGWGRRVRVEPGVHSPPAIGTRDVMAPHQGSRDPPSPPSIAGEKVPTDTLTHIPRYPPATHHRPLHNTPAHRPHHLVPSSSHLSRVAWGSIQVTRRRCACSNVRMHIALVLGIHTLAGQEGTLEGKASLVLLKKLYFVQHYST